MDELYLCRKCDKPKRKEVKGAPLKGKALCRALADRTDLPVKVVPCKCLGKCKRGPNAVLKPGKQRLHHLSLEELEALFAELRERNG